jgi:cytochrome c-type biogenesis protein CcmF
LWPVISGLVVGGAVVALGVRVWTSGLCFAFSAFVVGTIVQEFWRGARVRQGATGTDIFTALIGLVGRNKRRYGGYVIHVGVVLIFLGFAGNGFKKEEQVSLKPGQQATVGAYTVHLNSVKLSDDGQKQMITADTTVYHDGKELARMYPAKWYFRKHEEQPTTEVAIRRGFAEDFYLVMPAADLAEQNASMGIIINPLVDWIWFGFGVMAVGTGIALLPDTVFAFATASLPAGSVPTAMVLLALVLWPASVRAQTGQDVQVLQRSDLDRQVEGEVMCLCGCRAPLGNCPMQPNCGHWKDERARLASYISEGKDHDAVIAAFVKDYGGQDVLAAPIDRGFNRLAWLIPYVVGFLGLVAIFYTARRHSAQPSTAGDAPIDPSLNARLDDELRDLD